MNETLGSVPVFPPTCQTHCPLHLGPTRLHFGDLVHLASEVVVHLVEASLQGGGG